MKKIIMLSFAILMISIGKISAQIQSGLPVPLSLSQSISSKYLKKGQNVMFEVSSEVFDSEGELVIPQGTKAYGTVLSSKKRGSFGVPGKFEISVNQLTLSDGSRVELQADNLSAKGKSLKKRCNLYYALFPCWIITIPCAAFTHGGYATLDAGTSIQAYTK